MSEPNITRLLPHSRIAVGFTNLSGQIILDKNKSKMVCDLFERTSLVEEVERTMNLDIDECYMPKPFSKIEINEHSSMQVLATLDVSDMSTRTRFCDKLVYNLVSMNMIQVVPKQQETQDHLHYVKTKLYLADISCESEGGYQANSKDFEEEHKVELCKEKIVL